MFKLNFFIGLLLILPVLGFTQTNPIKINVKNEPLNVVFLQLRNEYHFQFSYSEKEIAQYRVTVSQLFSSKEEAIQYLIKGLPLKIKVAGDVFVIMPDKKKQNTELKTKPEEKKKVSSQISGQIVEAGSSEPLPYSHVFINNQPLVTDVLGGFNYLASADSTFHLRISHLGYYVYDTLLHAANFQQFKLQPFTQKMPEILVKNKVVERATMVGDQSGKITLNHNIAGFLPGQGDNSVFNLLRLMPGIQAAGEQSTDLLIWGSTEGQSLVTFDEFCLFGLKNYNDNISTINPFLVKNIEVLKGGFDARYGNRVGGLVNITGKNGSLQKPTFSLNINQTTLNGLVEFPVFKRTSVLLAYRQTYYNIYNSDDFNIYAPTRPRKKNKERNDLNVDLDVYPDDYRFRDLNFKISHQFSNGDNLYLSMYGGGDVFKLTSTADIERQKIGVLNQLQVTPISVLFQTSEKNEQRGATFFYGKTWSNRFSSKFVFSSAQFSKDLADSIQSKIKKTERVFKDDWSSTLNTVAERSGKIDNIYRLKKGHQLEFGVGFYRNQAQIGSYNNFRDTITSDTTLFSNNRAVFYLQDNWPIGSRFVLKTGARINFSNNRIRVHFEPRISGTYKLTDNLKLNASWGRYNQFMYKIATVDRDQNYTYLWVTSNVNIPVLSASHWVGGLTYSKNDFTFNVETYFKQTKNIVQRELEEQVDGKQISTKYIFKLGKAKTYGLDVYAKKDFGNHSIWVSYTLSKALESWIIPGSIRYTKEELAPQHQLHELKVAGLFNIKNFYLSADYVYGSGIQLLHEVFVEQVDRVDYNRVDAAVTYKFSRKRLKGEVGLSILNVFDTKNLKYANLKNVRLSKDFGDVRIYSDAVPFTPVLFLKLVF